MVMRERERDRSRDRERDRSPMIPREGQPRTRPPDRPPESTGGGVPLQMPLPEQPVVAADSNEVLVEDVSEDTLEDSAKEQRCQGSFSGDSLLKAREEEWMVEETPMPEQPKAPLRGAPRMPFMSYGEALKPTAKTSRPLPNNEYMEEEWDGNLVNSNKQDMLEGVTIRETNLGLEIEFSEKEKERLEKKWGQSLIIKLLGGSLGFMQMKRRVQTMWGVGGKVELSDIGNGYYIASFTDLDDYFFALEGALGCSITTILQCRRGRGISTLWQKK